MARKFLVPLDLGKNELQNAAVQSLGSPPGSPVKFQLYGNTGDNTLYWWDGTAWIPAKDTGAGTLTPGTITAETTFGTSKADGSVATYARSDHAHGNPVHDANAHSTIPLSALAVPTTAVSFNGQKITSLGTPTTGTDAVTKDYADNLTAGLSWKEAVRIATTGNVTQSGLAAIDGVTPIANDRILCKDQSTGSQNGIWLAQSGAWTRATDADASGELEGAAVFVMEGTANADKAFVNTTNAPITVGTTATVWVQFGAGTTYGAGNGLTLTGSTFDVVAADASIVVTADAIRAGYAGNGSAVTLARSDHNHDATYAKILAQDCAAATTTTVTHNFNTRDVKVEVYRNSTPWDTVDADVERPSVNTVEVKFATAPAAGAFRIIVEGIDQ